MVKFHVKFNYNDLIKLHNSSQKESFHPTDDFPKGNQSPVFTNPYPTSCVPPLIYSHGHTASCDGFMVPRTHRNSCSSPSL